MRFTQVLSAILVATAAVAKPRYGFNANGGFINDEGVHWDLFDNAIWQVDTAAMHGAKNIRISPAYWSFGVPWNYGSPECPEFRYDPYPERIDAMKRVVQRAKSKGLYVYLSIVEIIPFDNPKALDQAEWKRQWIVAYQTMLRAIFTALGPYIDVVAIGNENNLGGIAKLKCAACSTYYNQINSGTYEEVWALKAPQGVIDYWARYREFMQITKNVLNEKWATKGLTTNAFGYTGGRFIRATAQFHAALNKGGQLETQYDINWYPDMWSEGIKDVPGEVAKFRQFIKEEGAVDKPIGIEETGTNSGLLVNGTYREGYRLIPTMLDTWATIPGVKDVIIYQLQDAGHLDPSNAEAQFGAYDKYKKVKGAAGQAILDKVKQLNAAPVVTAV